MFQTISYASLLTVAVGIVIHAFAGPSNKTEKKETARSSSHSFLAPGLSLIDRIKRLAALIAVVSFAVLFVTSFGQRLLQGEGLHGYTLMAHVAFAPPFIVCLTFTALTWASRCRLTDDEWKWVSRLLHGQPREHQSDLGWKLSFWIAALLAIPASLSIVSMMYPVIGTHGQETLFEIHRYTTLALSLAAAVHIYLFLRSRR